MSLRFSLGIPQYYSLSNILYLNFSLTISSLKRLQRDLELFQRFRIVPFPFLPRKSLPLDSTLGQRARSRDRGDATRCPRPVSAPKNSLVLHLEQFLHFLPFFVTSRSAITLAGHVPACVRVDCVLVGRRRQRRRRSLDLVQIHCCCCC